MAYAHIVSTAKGNNPNGATTDPIDTTGADTIEIVVSSYSVAAVPNLTDSKGNSWNQRTSYVDGAGIGRTTIFYAENATVGSNHTFSISGLNSFSSLAVSAFSGSAGSSIYDTENGGNSASNTVQPGLLTPSEDNELIFTGTVFNAAGDSVSIDSGFTIGAQYAPVSGNSFGVAAAYKIQTTAAAVNPTWTAGSVSGGMASSIAAFKAAGGAPPVPSPFLPPQHIFFG